MLNLPILPVVIRGTHFRYIVVDKTHHVDDLFFDLVGANYHIRLEIMAGYTDPCILRPRLEPVHCAAGNKTGKFERSISELFSNLK